MGGWFSTRSTRDGAPAPNDAQSAWDRWLRRVDEEIRSCHRDGAAADRRWASV